MSFPVSVRCSSFTSAAALLGLVAGALATGLTVPASVQGQQALHPLIQEARPLLDARLRFEHVEQTGFEDNARALTVRVRLGAESGTVSGFRVLIEGDMTRALGMDDFNSGVPDGPDDFAASQYPLVPDPDSERINRLHLTWESPEGWSVVAGRQRIIHDNARFVGNVGFRQNEQTFDALRLQSPTESVVRVDYSYLWQVNRILGSNSPAGTADADTHLARVTWDLPLGTLSGHAYLVDLGDGLVGASNRTVGVRYAGQRALGSDLGGSWTGGYSRQTEHGDNPSDFSLAYWELEGRLSAGGMTASAGLEVLEGDGERGFATPLATLHAFQGFADRFLTTPPEGVRDLHGRLAYRWTDVSRLGTVRVAAAYHSYRAEKADSAGDRRDLGREYNLTLTAQPRPRVNLSVEFADYAAGHRMAGSQEADRTKLWVTAALALP